jgi:hypothetical protein
MQFEMVDAVRRSDPRDREGGGVAGSGRLDRDILQRKKKKKSRFKKNKKKKKKTHNNKKI